MSIFSNPFKNKKPLFTPLEASEEKRSNNLPKGGFSDSLKRIIAGGIPQLFTKTPAPETYKDAFAQRIGNTKSDIASFENKSPIDKANILALSTMGGGIKNVGNKITGKVLQGLENTSTKGINEPVTTLSKAPLKTLFVTAGTATGLVGAKSLFNTSSTTEYKKEEKPKEIEPENKKPTTRKDLYSVIHTLPSGTEVREAPERLNNSINEVYHNNPDLPQGLIEALLMKESSMGAHTNNKNTDIGEYAYLTGFTKGAKQDLIKSGYAPDLNTIEGVLDATAKFIELKRNIVDERGLPVHTYNNWTKFYNERYSSGKLDEEQLQTFDDMFNYYANS